MSSTNSYSNNGKDIAKNGSLFIVGLLATSALAKDLILADQNELYTRIQKVEVKQQEISIDLAKYKMSSQMILEKLAEIRQDIKDLKKR